jgi:hypothetical protein
MLIIGAKGFAKEVLEVLKQLNRLESVCFYDDVNDTAPAKLFGQFPVLRTIYLLIGNQLFGFVCLKIILIYLPF